MLLRKASVDEMQISRVMFWFLYRVRSLKSVCRQNARLSVFALILAAMYKNAFVDGIELRNASVDEMQTSLGFFWSNIVFVL